MIELTNRCTLRCPTCFSHQDDRAKADMSFQEFKNIIDDNHSLIESLSLYNYGEPLLNENMPEMIAYAKKKDIRFIKVSTNGMHLTATKSKDIINSGLDYLSISLDGATKETYEIFRIGGQFKLVVSNIRNLVKIRNALRRPLTIEIQFIIMRHNEHEVAAIEELARYLQVDRLRLKTVLIKKDKWKELLPLDAKYSRYSQDMSSTQCLKPLKELVINCDGTIIPCCYIVQKDIDRFNMGNIFDQPLKDILASEKYRSFIKKCTKQKIDLESCKDCNEGNHSLDYKIIELAHEQ